MTIQMIQERVRLVLVSGALVLSGHIAQGAALVDPGSLATFWSSKTFQNQLIGSYGFRSEVEPKFATSEEREAYQQVTPLIRDNPEQAIQKLTKMKTPQSSAILDFTLATLHFQEGRFQPAIENYRSAIAKFPDFLRAHKNLGLALVKEGQFEEGRAALTRTITLGGADSTVMGLLGFCHVNLENYLSAEMAYQNALMLDPNTTDWKLGLVKSYIGQEKFEQAKDALEELIRDTPDNAGFWNLQASVYLQMNHLERAAENFEIMRRLGYLKGGQLMILGDIYMTQGLKDMALGVYLEGVAQGGGQDLAKGLRAAEAFVSQGAWNEAKQLFPKLRSALNSQGDEDGKMQLLRMESKVALAEGRGAEAIGVLEEIIRKNPLDGASLLMVGEYYARNDEREKALFRFENAGQIVGFEADARVKQAQVMVQMQRYEQAVELLKQAQKFKERESVQKYLEAVERVARTSLR